MSSALAGEVEAAYRHYVDVFNSRDAAAIAAVYDHPHAQMLGEVGLSIVKDDAGQRQWYEYVMAYLDGQHWGRTEIDEVWVWPVSHTLAHVVARVTRYRTDGSVLNHVRANYTMRRSDDTWKVVLTFPLLDDSLDLPTFTTS